MLRPALCLLIAAGLPAAEEVRVRPIAWAQPVLGTRIGNLYQVTPDVYRSEQPDDDHLAALQALGVRSILSLRRHHEDDDAFARHGIRRYRVKMNAAAILPTEIAAALQIIRQAEKPILVHCWHGSDRTGVVLAAYRIQVQGWTSAAAVDEFIHGGFGYHAAWFPELPALLLAPP